jgi:hypothetical protein
LNPANIKALILLFLSKLDSHFSIINRSFTNDKWSWKVRTTKITCVLDYIAFIYIIKFLD